MEFCWQKQSRGFGMWSVALMPKKQPTVNRRRGVDAARGTKVENCPLWDIFIPQRCTFSLMSLPVDSSFLNPYCCCCTTQNCITLLWRPHRPEALSDVFEVVAIFCSVLPLNVVVSPPLCLWWFIGLFIRSAEVAVCMTVLCAVMTPQCSETDAPQK